MEKCLRKLYELGHASREADEIMVCLDPETATHIAQSRGHHFGADVLNAVLVEVEGARLD